VEPTFYLRVKQTHEIEKLDPYHPWFELHTQRDVLRDDIH